MATISLTLPTAGTVIAAGLHATNYSTLQALANGGIDNNNFAAGKIFDNTKLMQGGALEGQSLVWDPVSTSWKPGGVVARKTTSKDVVNTVAETDLLNGEVTIGAGVLGVTRAVRVTLVSDFLNNTGGNQTTTYKVKFGSTTMFGDLLTTTTSANRKPWWIQFVIANLGAANSQGLAGVMAFAGATPPSVAGTGGLTGGTPGGTIGGTAAEDTTTAKALQVTVTHGAANASLSHRLLYGLVEVV